jgi:CheY-like chemotaxis protein/anti-sigma regulatory factor (Ser/Thr protein kinase)
VGDDHRLSQVLTNVLTNAVKFTPEGGVIRLDARLEEETDGLCTLRIEVADTGIGISPEQQEKLFSAFGQAESGISREFGGTGLGLTIAKRIVELMDGKIWVESELGKGARFIFTIKARRGQKNLRSLLDPGVNWKTVRVLAVDDEQETRDYLKSLFDSLTVTCDVAADGFAAQRAIETRGAYDIYFIDWKMPGLDGIALTRWIKKLHDSKRHVVTMISAADWRAVRDTALASGVDKFLSKPLFASTIIDCVNECLGLHDDRQAEAPAQDARGAFTGKRMLLAEDIDLNREIVLALLEDTGLVIDSAENGREAVEKIEENPGKYDLVMMDMQMPHMDGLEATRRIRALSHPRARAVPIIAMTANVFKEDVDQCLAAGMNDHIGKPIDMEKMFVKLRKYLQ